MEIQDHTRYTPLPPPRRHPCMAIPILEKLIHFFKFLLTYPFILAMYHKRRSQTRNRRDPANFAKNMVPFEEDWLKDSPREDEVGPAPLGSAHMWYPLPLCFRWTLSNLLDSTNKAIPFLYPLHIIEAIPKFGSCSAIRARSTRCLNIRAQCNESTKTRGGSSLAKDSVSSLGYLVGSGECGSTLLSGRCP